MLVTFTLPKAENCGLREMAQVPRKGNFVHRDGVTYRAQSILWFADDEPRESDAFVSLGKG